MLHVREHGYRNGLDLHLPKLASGRCIFVLTVTSVVDDASIDELREAVEYLHGVPARARARACVMSMR